MHFVLVPCCVFCKKLRSDFLGGVCCNRVLSRHGYKSNYKGDLYRRHSDNTLKMSSVKYVVLTGF